MQLYSAAISTKGRIVISGIVTAIARFLGVEPNPKDRVLGSERLYQAAFEIMNFCKVEIGHLCWIYLRDRLLSLPNVDQTVLLHRGNLQWVLGDAEVVQPSPPPPQFTSQAGPSSSSHPPPIMPTSKPPLGPFRRSKCPFKPMLHLRMPFFMPLFKSGMMSSVGCLLPRPNTFRIIRLV